MTTSNPQQSVMLLGNANKIRMEFSNEEELELVPGVPTGTSCGCEIGVVARRRRACLVL